MKFNFCKRRNEKLVSADFFTFSLWFGLKNIEWLCMFFWVKSNEHITEESENLTRDRHDTEHLH